MKKQLSVFLILALLIFSMTACSTEDNSVLTGRTVLGLNEAGTYDQGHTQVTVLSAQENQGNEYDKPGKDKEFYIVTVEIKNTGTEDLRYYAADFKMYVGDNKIISQTFTEQLNSDTKLPSEGILKANQSVSGSLIYKVPTVTKNLNLLYYGSYISEPTIIFDLTQTAL